ncbi:ADP-ribose pyrophosphatase YjhB (NUDIX family) [Streptomyces glaucescens]
MPLHSVSVAGVVVREDGRVLVIRRADNGTWEPPGRVLERMEAIEDGVRREV